jgi:hypothetical protein
MEMREREEGREEKVIKSKAATETPKYLLLTPPCVLRQLAFISALLESPPSPRHPNGEAASIGGSRGVYPPITCTYFP